MTTLKYREAFSIREPSDPEAPIPHVFLPALALKRRSYGKGEDRMAAACVVATPGLPGPFVSIIPTRGTPSVRVTEGFRRIRAAVPVVGALFVWESNASGLTVPESLTILLSRTLIPTGDEGTDRSPARLHTIPYIAVSRLQFLHSQRQRLVLDTPDREALLGHLPAIAAAYAATLEASPEVPPHPDPVARFDRAAGRLARDGFEIGLFTNDVPAGL